ncbi:MAG: S-adenosylmethionine:tRNA ribosyltransferase-isomerase, partial [Cytophagales bacterium]|nr:S-adenosylmethionine:tRNA ribosyltransferase-isomerase [Cytophagales bacterium]
MPDDRIAAYPVEPRDTSKLLVYDSGNIGHHAFTQLADFLPTGTLLVFNDTKVIPARLYFRRDTGALIEIFLLQPENHSQTVHQALRQVGETTWHCMIGNKKRWKEGETLTVQVSDDAQAYSVKATLVDNKQNLVNFRWTPADCPFSEILPLLGEIPLPPYLNRKATAKDAETYQTVYSKKEGAVAAPTAGLHFTERVFDTLKAKGIASEFITLHVGAGTFQPIKAENVLQHPMHIEQIVFSRDSVRRFCQQPDRIFVVGTTSMRSMESLYWYGVKLLANADAPFFIEKLYPYEVPAPLPGVAEAFGAVLARMERHDLREIAGETQILIVPGYPFRVCKGLV